MNSILIIEDHAPLGEALARKLTEEGFKTSLVATLNSARKAITASPDIVILDWMLPDGQGLDFLQELRKQNEIIPVILLSARTELVDKVVALESGANDYLTKPFETRELVARIRAHLRTASQTKNLNEIDKNVRLKPCRRLTIELSEMRVFFDGIEVPLTRLEYELLKCLASRPGRVFPRETLLNQAWGYDSYPTTRTVDNHVAQLRQKFFPEIIESIRGVGYRFHVENK